MHMADGLVAPAVAAVMGAASLGAASYSVFRIKKDIKTDSATGILDSSKIPLMGVMGAFVFAAQMLNFTIPGTGSSGHICGGMLLAALLGPCPAFLTMIVILLLQCLIFADGGLLALGCNIWNMAFYACFFGYYCIYRPFTKKMSKVGIMAGAVLGAMISLQMGAFSVVLETMASGITSLPFGTFVALMQPIHLAIGLVEGVLTGLVLIFINQTRPVLLDNTAKENKLSYKTVIIVFAVLALVFGGGVSLVASSNPDGLEWSIEKTTGDTEVPAEGSVYEQAENIVGGTSNVFADYTVNGTEAASGTTIAGIVGSVITAAVCGVVCFVVGKKRRKTVLNEN